MDHSRGLYRNDIDNPHFCCRQVLLCSRGAPPSIRVAIFSFLYCPERLDPEHSNFDLFILTTVSLRFWLLVTSWRVVRSPSVATSTGEDSVNLQDDP